MNAAVERAARGPLRGFSAMKADGFPVECIQPQGAIYLVAAASPSSGRSYEEAVLDSNETIRKAILEHAGLAAVPFQAFGLMEETGWFRLSVGAPSRWTRSRRCSRACAPLLGRIR